MFKYPSLLRLAIVLAAVLVAQAASGQGSDYSEKRNAIIEGQYSLTQYKDSDFVLLELINKKYPDFPDLDREQVDIWWYRFAPEERPMYSPDEGWMTTYHPVTIRALSAVDYNDFVRKFWKCFNTEERCMLEENDMRMCLFNTIDNEGHVIEIPKMSVSPLSVGTAISDKSYSRLIKAVKRYFVYEDGGLMNAMGIDYYPGFMQAGNVVRILTRGGKAKISGPEASVYELSRRVLEALPFEYKHVDIQKILKQREKRKEKSHAR